MMIEFFSEEQKFFVTPKIHSFEEKVASKFCNSNKNTRLFQSIKENTAKFGTMKPQNNRTPLLPLQIYISF